MESRLAENIRKFRKERKLTQEQLAEVMGVTTGAVYKWESGMSVPELNLIMELADFFDISVDVLLGYKMKDNRLDTTIERLSMYCRTNDPKALTEAEKALKKYPNSFKLICHCASVYLVFGIGSHDKTEVHRALELLEQALLLLPQNTDPEISELTIYGQMSDAYYLLGDYDKALDLMKKHNVNTIFSDDIGLTLAVFMNKPEEAEPYLAQALLNSFCSMTNTVMGLAYLFRAKKNYSKAEEILNFGLDLTARLKPNDKTGYLDKTLTILQLIKADICLKTGRKEDASQCVEAARKLAENFDRSMDYSANMTRFVTISDSSSIHDGLGLTAKESTEHLIALLKNDELAHMWENKKKGR